MLQMITIWSLCIGAFFRTSIVSASKLANVKVYQELGISSSSLNKSEVVQKQDQYGQNVLVKSKSRAHRVNQAIDATKECRRTQNKSIGSFL